MGGGQKHIWRSWYISFCGKEAQSYLLFSFFSSTPTKCCLWSNNRRAPRILPETKLCQPGRSARSALLQIRKTNSVLVQLRGGLAALARRSDEVPAKSSLDHVCRDRRKMNECTFLESKFLLPSCKFVDDLQMWTPADHGSR